MTAARTPPHQCVARGCTRLVGQAHLMCGHHWRRVPRKLRQRIWGTWRPGQQYDHDPSPDFVHAVRLAILTVAQKERAA